MATAPVPNNANLEPRSTPGSKTSASQHMPSAREPGDLEGASPQMMGGRQTREGDEPQAVEYAFEESDARVVPKKPANSRVTPEESVEGRRTANGKSADETRP